MKKFQPKTCFLGWTKLRSGTLLPPIAPCSPFGLENRWGAIYYKNSNRKRVFWKNEFERAFDAKLSNVFVRNNFAPLNAPYSQLGTKKRYGAGFIKKLQIKTCFLGWTKLHSRTLLPPICHLVRLAKKIDEVRFSTKIQTENVFLGKTNLRGLLRQNWAKFSSGSIMPPNAPYSELGPEKRNGAGFIKKFHPKTCFLGWTKLPSETFLPPIVPSSPFGKENRWGAILNKNSNRKRVFWKNEFERAFDAKLSNVVVQNNFAPECTI